MTTDLKQQVGHRVAALREARGFTQEHLADLIGRSVEAISKIERGRAFPAPETLESMARHFGIEVRDLFPGGPAAEGSLERRIAQIEAIIHTLDGRGLQAAIEVLGTIQRLISGK